MKVVDGKMFKTTMKKMLKNQKGALDVVKMIMAFAALGMAVSSGIYFYALANPKAETPETPSYIFTKVAYFEETQAPATLVPIKENPAKISCFGATVIGLYGASVYENFEPLKNYGYSFQIGTEAESGKLTITFNKSFKSNQITIYAKKLGKADPDVIVDFDDLEAKSKITYDFDGTFSKGTTFATPSYGNFSAISISSPSSAPFIFYGLSFFDRNYNSSEAVDSISFKSVKTTGGELDSETAKTVINKGSANGDQVVSSVSTCTHVSVANTTSYPKRYGITVGDGDNNGELSFKLANSKAAKKIVISARPWIPSIDEGTSDGVKQTSLSINGAEAVSLVMNDGTYDNNPKNIEMSPSEAANTISIASSGGRVVVTGMVFIY